MSACGRGRGGLRADLRRMEREIVDGPYVIDVVDRLSVTFKRILLLLSLGTRIEILNRDPPLRRGRSVS